MFPRGAAKEKEAIPMSNDEKKQYLRRYLEAKRRASILQMQIEQLREDASSVSVNLDGMPHGNSHSDLSGYAAKLDLLLQKLEAEREEQVILYQEIKNEIDQMENTVDREILTRRYLLGQTWEKIAVEMNYEYRYLLRLHGRSLELFNIS